MQTAVGYVVASSSSTYSRVGSPIALDRRRALCSTRTSRSAPTIGTMRRPARLFGSTSSRSLFVVGALDVNHACSEIDLLPAQSHELATAQTCVERRRPDGAVASGQHGQQLLRLFRRRDPLTSAPNRWKPEIRARVHGDVPVLDCPAKDHAERHESVADRRRVAALGEEVVGDSLDVATLDIAQARRAETWDDVVAKGSFVAPDRTRLVEVSRTGADSTGLHPGNELLGRFAHARVRRRAHRSSADAGLRLRAPRTGLGEGQKGLADTCRLSSAPHARLVRRLAIAACAGARSAGLLVPDLDAGSLRHRKDATRAVGRPARQSRDSRATVARLSRDVKARLERRAR